MSLEHEFYLVPTSVSYREVMERSRNELQIIDTVDIPDELIRYIIDSLEWIPSKNPSKSMTKEEKGLNYYGVTFFDQASAEIMKGILISWHSLFSNSPDKLVLTGDYELSFNKKVRGEYERLVFSRAEVLKLLKKLICMVTKLKEGNFYLYHLGI